MTEHPKLWRKVPPEQCSLCGGHFGGESYIKLETDDGTPRLESWEGPTVVLCGRCVRGMHQTIGGTSSVDKPDGNHRPVANRASRARRAATPGTQRAAK